MKTNKHITGIIRIALVFWFFYDGVYKIAHFGYFGYWLHHAPLLSSVSIVLKYGIPTFEIICSLALLTRYRRLAFYGIIFSSVIFVFWVMAVFLFTNRLFWPFHAEWHKPTWLQKIALALFWAWMSFIALVLPMTKVKVKTNLTKNLRDLPAKASWQCKEGLLPRK